MPEVSQGHHHRWDHSQGSHTNAYDKFATPTGRRPPKSGILDESKKKVYPRFELGLLEDFDEQSKSRVITTTLIDQSLADTLVDAHFEFCCTI